MGWNKTDLWAEGYGPVAGQSIRVGPLSPEKDLGLVHAVRQSPNPDQTTKGKGRSGVKMTGVFASMLGGEPQLL